MIQSHRRFDEVAPRCGRIFRAAKPVGTLLVFYCAVTVQATAQKPGPSESPESLKRLSLEELSQLEVTSVTKEPVPAFRTPAAVGVLTSEQIHRSGARTIPDLLRLLPGVNVAQIDSSEWAIGVRGFQGKLSRSVLVLIDGRTVYTPLFAGVYWDMQDVMIEDIDRIELIRGPGGTIWGSNAVNGVINIITKNARDTHGFLVSGGGGNVDQGSLDWRYGGGDDAFSYRVWGKGFTRGPQEHPDGRNFDDWRRGQVGFRIDSRVSSRDELSVQGDAYGGEAGQRLQLSYFSPPSINTVDGYRYLSGENVMAAWRHQFDSGGDIRVRTYYDRTDRMELNYHEIRNTFDADFIHHIPLTRHDITWGLGIRTSPSEFFEQIPTLQFIPAKQTYNIFSGFVQDDISLVPKRLALTLGSKFEYTTYSGKNAQPSVRLLFTPDDNTVFWGSVTRAVRTASRIEDGFNFSFLSQASLPLYLRLIGDGLFTPEELIAYEVGHRRYIRKRGYIGLTLFHNSYRDLLSVESDAPFAESTPAPPRLILPLYLRNGINASSTGGELSALWDLRQWWRVRGSYSLDLIDARRSRTSKDVSTVGQLEGDSPAHTVTIQSSFELPRRIDLNLAYRYVSSIPDQRVPAYHTGDARIGWRLAGPWEIEAVGRNLFQPSHIEYGGVPGPLVGIKRSFYGGVIWRH